MPMKQGKKRDLTAASDDQGRRLDRILRKALPEAPLSLIHRLLRKGVITVDGKAAGPDLRLYAGAVISVPAGLAEPSPARKKAAPPVSLPVLWEGRGLIFINKPAGIPVHGAHSLDTLVQQYLAGRLGRSLSFKPGPLHRLDRPTSGVIAFSASLEGACAFSALMREGRIQKQYLAVLDGELAAPVRCAEPLARDREARKTYASPEGQPAETRFAPLCRRSGYSLAMAEISAGKTHQIRAHAAFLGCPLAGDRKYGGSFLQGGLLLHAESLAFPFPDKDGACCRVSAPLPPRFRACIAALFGENAGSALFS